MPWYEVSMKTRNPNHVKGIVYALISQVLFGFSFLAVKISVAQVSPWTLLSWRFLFAFAGMSLCALLGIFKINFRGKRLWPLLLLSFIQPVIYYAAEAFGIKLTTAAESSTMIACVPIATLLLSGPILKERPRRQQWLSMFVSTLGVIVVTTAKGASASLNVIGYLFLLLALFADSFFVLLSHWTADFSSTEKTYAMAAFGAFFFTCYALIEHTHNGTVNEFLALPFRDTDFLLSCLYLSVTCSIVAFLMCNRSIALLGACGFAPFIPLTTAVSVTAGVLILNEPISLPQGVGILMVLCGVFTANRVPKNAMPIPRIKRRPR